MQHRYPNLPGMTKGAFILAIFTLFNMQAKAQKFIDLMMQEHVNYQEVIDAGNEYFKQVGTDGETGYDLFKRWEYRNGRKISGDPEAPDAWPAWLQPAPAPRPS